MAVIDIPKTWKILIHLETMDIETIPPEEGFKNNLALALDCINLKAPYAKVVLST